MGNRGMGKHWDDRADRWVVDERGGGSQHFGWVSICRSFANIMTAIAKTMISKGNRNSMSSNFGSNLSWSFNNSLHHWNMCNCSNCTTKVKTSIRKTTISIGETSKDLGISFWGCKGDSSHRGKEH